MPDVLIRSFLAEDFADHVPGAGRDLGARALVVRELNERDGKRPAPTPLPRRVIDSKGGAEDVSRVSGEEVPRDAQQVSGLQVSVTQTGAPSLGGA